MVYVHPRSSNQNDDNKVEMSEGNTEQLNRNEEKIDYVENFDMIMTTTNKAMILRWRMNVINAFFVPPIFSRLFFVFLIV